MGVCCVCCPSLASPLKGYQTAGTVGEELLQLYPRGLHLETPLVNRLGSCIFWEVVDHSRYRLPLVLRYKTQQQNTQLKSSFWMYLNQFITKEWLCSHTPLIPITTPSYHTILDAWNWYKLVPTFYINIYTCTYNTCNQKAWEFGVGLGSTPGLLVSLSTTSIKTLLYNLEVSSGPPSRLL